MKGWVLTVSEECGSISYNSRLLDILSNIKQIILLYFGSMLSFFLLWKKKVNCNCVAVWVRDIVMTENGTNHCMNPSVKLPYLW